MFESCLGSTSLVDNGENVEDEPTTSACLPPSTPDETVQASKVLDLKQSITEPATSARGFLANSDKPEEKPSKKIRSLKSNGKSVRKKANTVKWPCGICEKDFSTDAVCWELCDT